MIANLNSKKFFFCDNPNLALGVLAGVAAFGGVTLATPQKAEAMSVYGFSKLEWEASILLNGNAVPNFFDASGETNASILANESGGLIQEDNVEFFNFDGFADTPQSYVNNNGPQNSTIVPENTFNPPQGSFPGIGGTIGPDFARGDSYACDTGNTAGENCLDFGLLGNNNLVAANVAEGYIKGENDFVIDSGESEGSWLLATEFAANAGDNLVIDTEFLYEVAAGIDGWESGENKIVEAAVEWELDVIDVTTNTIIGELVFGEALDLFNDNGLLQDSGTVSDRDLNLVLPTTGNYAIAIGGDERVSGSSQNITTPEPGTILGLLAIGGLGIGLKRKKQSKQLPV